MVHLTGAIWVSEKFHQDLYDLISLWHKWTSMLLLSVLENTQQQQNIKESIWWSVYQSTDSHFYIDYWCLHLFVFVLFYFNWTVWKPLSIIKSFSPLIWPHKTFDLKMRDFSLPCEFQMYISIQLSSRPGCC